MVMTNEINNPILLERWRAISKKMCPRCHGQRTIPCLPCHGTGKIFIGDNPIRDCEKCGGTGRRLCEVCSGTGEVEN